MFFWQWAKSKAVPHQDLTTTRASLFCLALAWYSKVVRCIVHRSLVTRALKSSTTANCLDEGSATYGPLARSRPTGSSLMHVKPPATKCCCMPQVGIGIGTSEQDLQNQPTRKVCVQAYGVGTYLSFARMCISLLKILSLEILLKVSHGPFISKTGRGEEIKNYGDCELFQGSPEGERAGRGTEVSMPVPFDR